MASGAETTYVGAQDLGAEIWAPYKRALAAPLWISRLSRHSRGAEPTQRSANAFAIGLQKGRWMTSTPSLLKTSSKAALNFESRFSNELTGP